MDWSTNKTYVLNSLSSIHLLPKDEQTLEINEIFECLKKHTSIYSKIDQYHPQSSNQIKKIFTKLNKKLPAML